MMLRLTQLVFFLGLQWYVNGYAHLEPAITLTQKIQDLSEKAQYKKHHIELVVCYFTDSTFQSLNQKYYEQRYDSNGNLVELLVYGTNQLPESRIIAEYDRKSNLIKQQNLDSINRLINYATYTYDDLGRVLSYKEYSSKNDLVALFQYQRNAMDTSIILTKSDSNQKILYHIDYRLIFGLDGLISSATKLYNDKNQKDSVFYQYDQNGNVVSKKVYKNDAMLFTWTYQYDENGNEILIQKVNPKGLVEIKIENQFDSRNLKVRSIQTISDSTKTYFRYVYHYFLNHR
ncbi:MAG: hypothetical protein N2450_08455 [bacterium]|nr:hypothetical protein [bacterium]